MDAFKDHYNLSEDDLNQEISDSHLDQIALKHCACWKLLSPHLDLGNMTINDLEAGGAPQGGAAAPPPPPTLGYNTKG